MLPSLPILCIGPPLSPWLRGEGERFALVAFRLTGRISPYTYLASILLSVVITGAHHVLGDLFAAVTGFQALLLGPNGNDDRSQRLGRRTLLLDSSPAGNDSQHSGEVAFIWRNIIQRLVAIFFTFSQSSFMELIITSVRQTGWLDRRSVAQWFV